jgi:hypothetical protein
MPLEVSKRENGSALARKIGGSMELISDASEIFGQSQRL